MAVSKINPAAHQKKKTDGLFPRSRRASLLTVLFGTVSYSGSRHELRTSSSRHAHLLVCRCHGCGSPLRIAGDRSRCDSTESDKFRSWLQSFRWPRSRCIKDATRKKRKHDH